jgi:hypothetical protein
MRIGKRTYRIQSIDVRRVNAVLGLAASLVLSGVPPEVCENTISEVVTSVRKSLMNLIP